MLMHARLFDGALHTRANPTAASNRRCLRDAGGTLRARRHHAGWRLRLSEEFMGILRWSNSVAFAIPE